MLVTLDGQTHDPDVPLLHADDLAAVRGDGIFETLLVRDGKPCLLEAHLARLAQSAKMLDLPAPDLDAWRAAVAVGARCWAADQDGEGVLRLVYSRGRESGGPPTAFATVGALPDRVTGVRRNGLAAIALDRGLPLGASDMPWLAAGAKTLSYAINMAALRHAERQGAGDVIFVSSDGYLLEGPRSTVVIATEGADSRPVLLTPPPWYPILRGTTQQALFEVARNKGYDCDFRALGPADLLTAQGVWLVSSITLAARVHTLDGQRLPDAPLAAEISGLVDAALTADR
ncbi:aminodeoxychorismate lyase [Mycobacterium sp. TNTM28]|uniref:Aminodeoxychorismate lyase n=1 Tax=[Mycobacterium] fortunisiensis TaxID=2600579 RepID=A0ABS6KIW8_9MYCO|nr:aminodeoxychorismate lyase [[Mycobacterium] fortunisiensis]